MIANQFNRMPPEKMDALLNEIKSQHTDPTALVVLDWIYLVAIKVLLFAALLEIVLFVGKQLI